MPLSSLKMKQIHDTEFYDVTYAVEGMAMDAFDLFQEKYNFSFQEILMRTDRKWGSLQNGT